MTNKYLEEIAKEILEPYNFFIYLLRCENLVMLLILIRRYVTGNVLVSKQCNASVIISYKIRRS